MVIFVFFVLALLKEDPLQSLLFAVAWAVGLTPELLPMILAINLSRGAVGMSKKGVFQTAWFIESLFTQTLVVFVIRTRRTPFTGVFQAGRYCSQHF